MKKVIATPFSSLIARDGRPFSLGGKANSYPWITPSAFVGALRTTIGKKSGMSFSAEECGALKKLAAAGPLPCLANSDGSVQTVYFPKPCDCVVSENSKTKKRKLYVLRPTPLNDGEGVDMPCAIRPALLMNDDGSDAFKPVSTVPFWSYERMLEWLERADPTEKSVDEFPQLKEKVELNDGLGAFDRDVRVGIGLSDLGTTTDGSLFTTTGLEMFNKQAGRSLSVYSQIVDDGGLDVSGEAVGSLGGKRRLARWKFDEGNALEPSEELLNKAKTAKSVRMVLATPAVFKNGYLPGWLDDNLVGTPPGLDGVLLKLDSVAIGRWLPVSGWSVEKGKEGPKPVRRLAPAGSVYFFTVEKGSAEELVKNAWLRSVSDDPQDRRDGFGSALWGVCR